mgnify:CR=1 FL=1
MLDYLRMKTLPSTEEKLQQNFTELINNLGTLLFGKDVTYHISDIDNFLNDAETRVMYLIVCEEKGMYITLN